MKTNLNQTIEYTNLKYNLTDDALMSLCKEAIDNDFYGVCVPPDYVKKASDLLSTRDTKVITVINFPMGYGYSPQAFSEAKMAIEFGADELDIVINHGNIFSGNWDAVEEEIRSWGKFGQGHSSLVKIIIETEHIEDDSLKRIADCMIQNKVDFFKTATGINGKTSADKVRMIKNHVDHKIKIKAAGGIKTINDAIQMREAGADRIGTSSLIVS